MSTAPAPASTDTLQGSTAAPPQRRRAILGWLFVIALLIGIALLSLRLVATAPPLSGVLNPDSPAPTGAKAIAELVRQQGTEVEVVRSRAAASAALRSDSTLVLTDPTALSDDAVGALLGQADRVVLLSTSSRMLDLLELGTSASGLATADAGCDIAEFRKTGEIAAVRMFMPDADVEGCYRGADGAAALLVAERDGARISFIEATRLLSNRHLVDNGNAALGLALLAQTDHLVWYVGSFEDGDRAQETATLGDLTPSWLTPTLLLLLLSGVAAICWRGGRFGPLVAESLPVTVRASETMHGRARLTAKAADAPHAASAIREGTRTRLTRRLALSPRATATEIADAAADRLGIPRGSLQDLLDGSAPSDDRELIDLARRLAELETALDAVHTEGKNP